MIQGARRLTGPAAPAHRRLTRINAGALRRANPAQPALRRSVVVASPGDHMSAFEQTARFLRSALQAAEGEARTVETHASLVFIGRDHVWKLKKPVRYPYLDFSTPQRRIAACRAELALNARFAPRLYVRVRQIVREANGRLAFDAPGDAVDAVVEMRSFVQSDLLDAMAARRALSRPVLERLAATVARSHDIAPQAAEPRAGARVANVLSINDRSLRASGLFPETRCDAIRDAFRRRFDAHARLIERRGGEGKIRRCHGDLTLRNICMFEGEPTLFDCLEFDEELATIDVLYDLSFLLMDIWRHGLRDDANWCFNRYLDARDETDGLALVPFFMAMRACVRAHVAATDRKSTRLNSSH